MYYFEKLKFTIPESKDLRRRLTTEQKEEIRRLKKYTNCTYKYLAQVYQVNIHTIMRVCLPDMERKNREAAKRTSANKRARRTKQDKVMANLQKRETVKRRIKHCREYMKDQNLPVVARWGYRHNA